MLCNLQHWACGALFAPESNAYSAPSIARVMLAIGFIDGATMIGDRRLGYGRSIFWPAENLDFIMVQVVATARGAWEWRNHRAPPQKQMSSSMNWAVLCPGRLAGSGAGSRSLNASFASGKTLSRNLSLISREANSSSGK